MLHTDTTPRARRREAKIRDILDAAMHLVVSAGFDGLTMQQLADAVDLTPGALYRYFRGKDAIVVAITTQAIAEYGEAIQAALDAQPDATPIARILTICLTYRRLADAQPARFGMISLLLADPRVLVPHSGEAVHAVEHMLAALRPIVSAFEEAASQGDLDPGDALERSVVMFTATHGVLQLRKQSERLPGVLNIDRLVRVSLTGLLTGWGADGTTLSTTYDAALHPGGPA